MTLSVRNMQINTGQFFTRLYLTIPLRSILSSTAIKNNLFLAKSQFRTQHLILASWNVQNRPHGKHIS